MEKFKSGDIVRVFYPFKPKVLSEENEVKLGKTRFGVIINAKNDKTVALPILQILTRDGKTEKPNYRMRDDEIKVPPNLTYYKPSLQKRVPINGVIKTERIELFDYKEIIKKVSKIDLVTKSAILKNYKGILKDKSFLDSLNRESPGHKEAMQCFERVIIAEKLRFLTTSIGECKYEYMEEQLLKINKIQPLGKSDMNKRIHFYAVELTDEENKDSFFYTIASMKQPEQVAREWGKPKTAIDWLKEDERFYNLQKDITKVFKETPNSHPNRYKAFSLFRENTIENAMER
ncbi:MULTISPECIES: hypothetical protein [Bacillus cereus group]|uniref:hypothetical protein n=1 Tax=Bacillus cereus group TaxID=86661 RepID=UPI00123ACF25|nr:hypothetical protein [Bacillus cereus]KAA6458930.1 hypothetical protein DX930_28205 [Bacillus cereus]KAB2412500.1 hypothetical protein F8169_30375 [Bacillus cereus]KAB2435142.1 hypothetical protein F8166_17770 [Bacillus cereus]KAB2461746.1 hypothetical protein F8164_31120 [Bacillus cereus]